MQNTHIVFDLDGTLADTGVMCISKIFWYIGGKILKSW